ncbi:hypothetical protein BGZ49_003374, partial [Haplosporangium sp. Z 27]
MLDYPEIDAIICKQLQPKDLAICSQVNKQWSRIVIPHLWKDISVVSKTEMFFYLVSTDGLPLCVSEFEKYIEYIQLIPSPFELFNNFVTSLRMGQGYFAGTSQRTARYRGYTAIGCMMHLMKRCPNIQVHYLDLDSNIYSHPDLLEFTLEYYFPLVQDLELHIVRTRDNTTVPLAFRNIMNQITCCSNRLKRLTLNSDEFDHSIATQEEEDEEVQKKGRKTKKLASMIPDNNQDNERQAEEESSPTLQLNELVLDGYSDN